jgi:hypothetical protein
MVFFHVLRYIKTTAMNPFILFIILQYNTWKCKLNMDGVDYPFKSDTMQVLLASGAARLKLSCANGWWVNIKIQHDGKKRRTEYLPIDTRNQQPCKTKATQADAVIRNNHHAAGILRQANRTGKQRNKGFDIQRRFCQSENL